METIVSGMFLTMALVAALALLVCWLIIYSAVRAGTKKAIIDALLELNLIKYVYDDNDTQNNWFNRNK